MLYQIGGKQLEKTREKLKSIEQIVEDYIKLFTCERAEIYTTKNIKIDLPKRKGREALKHLLYVTCGIDSLVLGEIEILEQVNNAFKRALKNKHCSDDLSGYFSFTLDKAKEIRKATGISRSFPSEFIDKIVQRHLEKPITIIGTGVLGVRLIESFKNKNYPLIYITSKYTKRAKRIGKNYKVSAISLDAIKKNSVVLVTTEHITESTIDALRKNNYIYDLRHSNYLNLVKKLKLARSIPIEKIKKLIDLNVEKFYKA